MKIVAVDQNNLTIFNELQSASNEVYSSLLWSKAYTNGLKKFLIVNDNDSPIGGFVLYEKIKWGVKIWITPPFASHCGWFAKGEKTSQSGKLSETKKIAQAISDFLKQSRVHFYKIELPPQFEDAQPFIWNEQEVSIRYTYVINIAQAWENVVQNFDAKLRNKWNKLATSDFSISFEKNTENAYQLFTGALQRNGAKWDEYIVKHLMDSPLMHHVHVYENNQPVATALFAGQGNKCYYLFGAADKERGTAAGPIALVSAMQRAKEMGFAFFDLEGSMIPEVESYFRQFGGEHQSLFTIKGGRGLWPRLLKTYLKL